MTCIFSQAHGLATWTILAKRIPVLVLMLSATAALAIDELFPEIAKDQVTVQHKQDGRAVRGLIINGSSLMVSSVEVVCTHQAPLPACAEGKGKYSSFISLPDAPPCYIALTGKELVVPKKVTILPGKNTNFYAEIPAGRNLLGCEVREVRGRDKQWFNF